MKKILQIGAITGIGLWALATLATAFFGFTGWTASSVANTKETIREVEKEVAEKISDVKERIVKNETNIANIYDILGKMNTKLDILIKAK